MVSPRTTDRRRVTIPPGQVLANRVIWAALLAGQVVAAAALGFVVSRGDRAPQPPAIPTTVVTTITGAMLVFAVVMVVGARAIGFRGATTDQAIRARYGTRMILAMAPLDGASFTGIVLAFTTGHALPVGIVSAVALALQLTLFPRADVSLPD